jgi:hypothetical protein
MGRTRFQIFRDAWFVHVGKAYAKVIRFEERCLVWSIRKFARKIALETLTEAITAVLLVRLVYRAIIRSLNMLTVLFLSKVLPMIKWLIYAYFSTKFHQLSIYM